MDLAGILSQFNTLGPALGSVVVIGLICYNLLKMISRLTDKLFTIFDAHLEALNEVKETMKTHAESLEKVGENLEANTKVTENLFQLVLNNKH